CCPIRSAPYGTCPLSPERAEGASLMHHHAPPLSRFTSGVRRKSCPRFAPEMHHRCTWMHRRTIPGQDHAGTPIGAKSGYPAVIPVFDAIFVLRSGQFGSETKKLNDLR